MEFKTLNYKPIKNKIMEQNTNDNEMSQMEQHVRRLLDKHKKRDEYEKSSQEPNKNDYNMGLGHNEAYSYKKDMEAHSTQSKEFTDALNFVLNYRENMEGMDGFIPSSDLAEMLVIYTNPQPLPNTVPQQVREEVSADDIFNVAVREYCSPFGKPNPLTWAFIAGAKWMQSHPVNTGDGKKYLASEVANMMKGAFKAGKKDISCQCSNEIKTGQTSVMCCNICGKPDEKSW